MQYCATLCCAGNIPPNFENRTECATCKFGKLHVVLDLDETLVSCQSKYCKYTKSSPLMEFDEFLIYKRPNVDVFLEFVFKRYHVSIWTAAIKTYAEAILAKLLKPDQKPINVFSRNHALIYKHRGFWDNEKIKIKPLMKFGYDLARTVMIDDTKSSFSQNVWNGLLIKGFEDPDEQYDDRELLLAILTLTKLADCDDVRTMFRESCSDSI